MKIFKKIYTYSYLMHIKINIINLWVSEKIINVSLFLIYIIIIKYIKNNSYELLGTKHSLFL